MKKKLKPKEKKQSLKVNPVGIHLLGEKVQAQALQNQISTAHSPGYQIQLQVPKVRTETLVLINH